VRVLFDAHHLGRHQTGNETYARELLRGLASRASVEAIAAVDPGADLAGLDSGRLDRVELPRRAILRLPALGLASRRLKADLLHSMYYLPPMARRPVVVSIHDVSFERHPEFFSRRELYKNRLAVGWAARHADMVLGLTEHARAELVRVYDLDPGRIKVVPAGVGEAFLRAGASREIDGGGDRPLRVLAVGAIQPRKNLARLVQALRRVARTRAVVLRVIGPAGHTASRIRASLHDSAVTVEAVGYVDEDALVQEYRRADVFAYPSIYEGFGIPIIEAMACGTPVVTSTGGALPEVAGDAALLVDPHDVDALAAAIQRVGEDDVLRADLVGRGRERAQRFTWSSAVDRLVEAYRDALGRGG
jgi:glycosyltransferase involved in cell wall biosynthesis